MTSIISKEPAKNDYNELKNEVLSATPADLAQVKKNYHKKTAGVTAVLCSTLLIADMMINGKFDSSFFNILFSMALAYGIGSKFTSLSEKSRKEHIKEQHPELNDTQQTMYAKSGNIKTYYTFFACTAAACTPLIFGGDLREQINGPINEFKSSEHNITIDKRNDPQITKKDPFKWGSIEFFSPE